MHSAPPGHCLTCADRGVVSLYSNSTRTGEALVSATTNGSGGYQLHVRPGTYYLAFKFSGRVGTIIAGPKVVVTDGHTVVANIVNQ